MYSNKKVSLIIVEYFPVLSKKLEKTVIIGIATTADIINEFKYQMLNLLSNILPLYYTRYFQPAASISSKASACFLP